MKNYEDILIAYFLSIKSDCLSEWAWSVGLFSIFDSFAIGQSLDECLREGIVITVKK